jgi:hypothetical protein
LSWMVKGQLKPTIGNDFQFKDIIQAHELIESGHKFGNTVISF